MNKPTWLPAWHNTGECIDVRHILWVYELLMRMKPQRTLEIGGYSGCSSSAFVAAGIPDAHFAEIAPRRDFIEVVNGHGTIHARKGCEVLDYSDPFDVVLVDGSHEMGAVQEGYAAMMRKPRSRCCRGLLRVPRIPAGCGPSAARMSP